MVAHGSPPGHAPGGIRRAGAVPPEACYNAPFRAGTCPAEEDGVGLPEEFRLVATIRARFRDTDGMGHVNNAVYLTYLEEARAAWFREAVGLRSYRDVSIILARTCCDFRSPLQAGETLDLGVRVDSIGGKSFRMVYRAVERASGRLVLEAESVQVWYDYAAGRPVPVPDAFRERASAFEGRPL